MKKIISIALVCLLAFSICACSSTPSLVGTVPTGDKISSATPSEDAANRNKETFKLGDSVELDNVIVTFLNVTEASGSQFNKPREGNIFLLCEFEIDNNSTEEISVSSILSFEAYCDDYACEYSLGALLDKGTKDQLDGSVAAGKKMKGVVGYEVPADWKELEVQYTLDLFNDQKIIFVVTNN